MNEHKSTACLDSTPRAGNETPLRRLLFVQPYVGAYIVVVLLGIFGAYLSTLRRESIFACPGSDYGPDVYLAYCHATQYGDYDHGAFWFDLEPPSLERAANADVLFLGNSRLQFGFSTQETANWFPPADYYLMGFAYWENYLFERELLRRIKPRAKVYIINLDSFFEQTKTPPARIVMEESDARARYLRKRLWQAPHAFICSRFASICGTDEVFYRSRKTGGYQVKGGQPGSFSVSYDDTVDSKLVLDYSQRAEDFIAGLPVDRRCVLLTIVPNEKTNIGSAKAIAKSLDMTLMAPELADLSTFDHSHLNKTSAERWSDAFLASAGTRIKECLGEATSSH